MAAPRRISLYDPASNPSSWNERMPAGTYAVHFSDFEDQAEASAPFCLVFDSVPEATAFAEAEVVRRPALRCRIYSQDGFTGAPLREYRGTEFHDRTDISPVFRRWGGIVLFFGGMLLFGIDAAFGYRWLWPSMLGSRMMMPGLVLVVTEVFVLLYARHHRRQAAGGTL
jgi:hypothetical protein